VEVVEIVSRQLAVGNWQRMGNQTKEEIIKVVERGFGREYADQLIEILKQRPGLFDDMMEVYFANEEPVSRRIAWSIDIYTEEVDPDALLPYVEKICTHLPEFQHDGLKRHSLRMLSRAPLPEENFGRLISICFDFLVSPTESPAVKAHAMEILYRAVQVEPDLRQELIDSIEWRLQEESVGVRNRGQKILAKLYRQ